MLVATALTIFIVASEALYHVSAHTSLVQLCAALALWGGVAPSHLPSPSAMHDVQCVLRLPSSPLPLRGESHECGERTKGMMFTIDCIWPNSVCIQRSPLYLVEHPV